MSHTVILLTPLIVLLIVAVFGFTGCSHFTAADDPPETVKNPPPVVTPPDPVIKPAASYEDLVKKTAGFAAFWPFNEAGGNIANVVGPLNPGANGLYVAPGVPAGNGYKVGQQGLLFSKDNTDLAPTFDGTAGYVEIPFQGPLNPDKKVPGFTIELWAKPNPNAGPATQILISSHRNDGAGAEQGYEIALVKNAAQPNQQIRGRVFANGAMTEMLVQPLGGDPAEWRHIVMTYEPGTSVQRTVSLVVQIGKTANPFKDGPHSAAYEAVLVSKASSLRFGAGHAVGQAAGQFFAGQIDNVAFYNAVVPQTELDKHFNAF